MLTSMCFQLAAVFSHRSLGEVAKADNGASAFSSIMAGTSTHDVRSTTMQEIEDILSLL
jgi:hypothetical protein